MQAASYLVYACQHLNRPQEVIAKAFGENFAALALETTKLVHVQKQARSAGHLGSHVSDEASAADRERAQDAAGVLARPAGGDAAPGLAAADAAPCGRQQAARCRKVVARESLQVFAPLANRLGIWQVKWEIEDLSFRFLEPDTYKLIARLLDEKRVEREGHVEQLRSRLERELRAQGIRRHGAGPAEEHLQHRQEDARQVARLRRRCSTSCALRVVVPDVKDCYAALAWVHSHFRADREEFDDYIARPKPNGYQSLHTVVREMRDGRPASRSRSRSAPRKCTTMPSTAWPRTGPTRKRATRATRASGPAASTTPRSRCCASCWRGSATCPAANAGSGLFDDRIYVLTPDAAIVELPQGATPVDFAYTVHTSLGHRCRGARIDGAMVPLNTPLAERPDGRGHRGQGGRPVARLAQRRTRLPRKPPRHAPRCAPGSMRRPRTRPWRAGREAVEKLLQREGQDRDEARRPGRAAGLQVGRSTCSRWSARTSSRCATSRICLRPPEPLPSPDDEVLLQQAARRDEPPARAACWWSGCRR